MALHLNITSTHQPHRIQHSSVVLVRNFMEAQCHSDVQSPNGSAPAGLPVGAKRQRGWMKIGFWSADTRNNLCALRVVFEMPRQLSLTLPSFVAFSYNNPNYSFLLTESADLELCWSRRQLLISNKWHVPLTLCPFSKRKFHTHGQQHCAMQQCRLCYHYRDSCTGIFSPVQLYQLSNLCRQSHKVSVSQVGAQSSAF